MKKYNITRPEKYTTKDGEEKTMWHRVGEIVLFDEGGLCKLYMFPEEFKVFERKDRPKESNEGMEW